MSNALLDAAGRHRLPATMPGFHAGQPPRNKGRRYPADPPTVEEIVAVKRQAGTTPHGLRILGLIIVLWRAGLRIHEALALTAADLDARRSSVLVRRGKGGRRREVGMDDWAWEQLQQWLTVRVERPVGPLLCILTAPTAYPWPAQNPRSARSTAGSQAWLPYHPHIQHTNLGITSIYLQDIDSAEIIDTVHARRPSMVPVDSSLRP